MLLSAPASINGLQALQTTGTTVQHVDVALVQGAPSLTPADTLTLRVDVALSAPAEYFEVRVRVVGQSGSLMYQKTEVRHDVVAGTTSVGFERALSDLSLTSGRYPIEVRVLASGAEPTVIESRMIVATEDLDPLPIVVIPRLTCSPALDPTGRFALDPATHDSQREAVEDLLELVAARSESLTLALPPLLLEEWSRVAAGYQLSGAGGVIDVPADAEIPVRYAATLAALARAAQTGAVELIDVPYAEPDIAGLQAIDAVEDLGRHYEYGRPIYSDVLGVEPSTGTALDGDLITAPAARIIVQAGHGYMVCSPASAADTVTPGIYRESVSDAVALVTDPVLAALVASGTAEGIYDHLYDLTTAEARPAALVVTLDIGPGESYDAEDVRRLLSLIDGAPWLDPVPAARAAQAASDGILALAERVPPPTGSPAGYWDDVAQGRRSALGLAEAWGVEDPASAAALTGVLVSESACWAGPDGSYPFADRGRAFSTSVSRLAEDTFGAVRLEIRDVTLAARKGDVPLTIISSAERPLVLRIETRSAKIEPRSTETTVLVSPADNFLTVPVDLGSSVSDSLDVRIMAGDVLVAETTVTVRASYLDRLTTMVTVVLVLIALLVFIRRRVKSADAGTMPDEACEGGD